ncbi:MAG: hypothetical protein AAGA30_15355 [Planctomycetota bacterium]
MQKIIISTLIALFLASIANAQCDECPSCGAKVATGVPKTTKVKKKVYNVECEDIAVPNICLPKPFFSLREQLGKLFTPKCVPGNPCGDACDGGGGCTCEPVRNGHVRTIKVLKKKSVECEKCSYKWEVTDLSPCEGNCDTMDAEGVSFGQTPPQPTQPFVEKTNPAFQQQAVNVPIHPNLPKPATATQKSVSHVLSDQIIHTKPVQPSNAGTSSYYAMPKHRGNR